MPEPTAGEASALASYLRGLARGVGPDLLGGPVDLARDVLNLGIAGAGYAGHKTGLLKEPLPLIEPGAVGDSDWWANKTNVSDDGTGAYTAGRLTTLAPLAAKAAGEGGKRLVNALVSRTAPSRSGPIAGPKSQVGAIRVGGREDLMPSHSTSLNSLEGAMGRGKGPIELSNPSIGITQNSVLNKFADGKDSVELIPRVGAFDPATAASTLLNRDAFTPRYMQFKGKSVGHATKIPDVPFHAAHDGDVGAALNALGSDPKVLGSIKLDESLSPELKKELGQLLMSFPFKTLGELRDLGKAYAGLELPGAMAKYGHQFPENVKKFGVLYRNSDSILTPGRDLDMREEARYRMLDRLFPAAVGKDVAGMESSMKFSGSKVRETPDFNGDVTGNLARDIAVRGSPAFRSFADYERSPLGANLLTPGGHSPNFTQFEEQSLSRALQKWVPNLEAKIDDMGLERDELLGPLLQKQLAGASSTALKQYWGRMLRGDQFEDFEDSDRLALLKDFPSIEKALYETRKQFVRAPSEYAELKVHGPVAVTPENFAGAIIRTRPTTDAQHAVLEALQRTGLPIQGAAGWHDMSPIKMYQEGLIQNATSKDYEKFWFDKALDMQNAAGPARKSRMFDR